MSIQERIDLVGNVSAQARTWMRDVTALAAATRSLNRAQAGGGGARNGGGGGARVAGQKQELAQMRAIYKAEEAAKRDFVRNMAKYDKDAASASRKAAAERKASQKKSSGPTLVRQEKGGIGGVINSAVGNLAASAAAELMGQLTSMLASMAKTFVAAQLFREASLAGLTILQKSGAEAKKTWDESFKIARQTGSTQQETMTSLQKLMATGFQKGDAVELFKLMNAISVVNPSANLDGIVTAISQIKNTGKLQGDELMQLADAGVNIDEVYNQLGKRLGKTREQIMKMQAAGEIKSADAIEAIKAAMKQSVGGDVDKVLKQKANSWTSILGRLQAAPFTFFAGLDKMDPSKADKLKAALISVTDMLDPSTEKGAKFAESMGKLLSVMSGPGLDAFVRLVDLLGPAADRLNSTAESAEKLDKALKSLQSQTGIDLLDALGLDGDGVLEFFIGPLYEIPTAIYAVGEQIGVAGGDIITSLAASMLAAAMGPVNTIYTIGAYALDAISGVAGEFMGAGYEMVAGLAAGITGGASMAIQAAVDMASSALAAAKAALSINSPSRVFRDDVGTSIPEGLADGIHKNMATVTGASKAMGNTAVGETQKNIETTSRSHQALNGGGATPTQRALPFVGTAMRDLGVGGGQQTNNYLGGMRINAPIQSMSGNSTPQDIQAHIQRMIQQGVQGFMNQSAQAA